MDREPSSLQGLPMVNLELQRITLADQVYGAMRGWILDGTLAPGTPLRIRQIASSLVVTRPHKGAVVAGLSAKELRDFYGARIVLEAEAARLGAERISPTGVKAMKTALTCLDRAAKHYDVLEALKFDEVFLGTLYKASDNAVLMNLIRSLWNRVQPYRVLWASTAERRGGIIIWSHKPRLLEAASAHDGSLAASIVVESLIKACKELEHLIERAAVPHSEGAATTAKARRT